MIVDTVSQSHLTILYWQLPKPKKLSITTTNDYVITLFQAKYVSLHVRKSNRAALNLYTNSLHFKILDIEPKYYADGEDAYSMQRDLSSFAVRNDQLMEIKSESAIISQCWTKQTAPASSVIKCRHRKAILL